MALREHKTLEQSLSYMGVVERMNLLQREWATKVGEHKSRCLDWWITPHLSSTVSWCFPVVLVLLLKTRWRKKHARKRANTRNLWLSCVFVLDLACRSITRTQLNRVLSTLAWMWLLFCFVALDVRDNCFQLLTKKKKRGFRRNRSWRELQGLLSNGALNTQWLYNPVQVMSQVHVRMLCKTIE